MSDIVIVGGVRTAIGDFGGALKDVPPTILAQNAIEEVVKKAGIEKSNIEKVILGNCFSPVDANIARIAAYQAGIPQESPAFSINATCGSSMQAVISGCQAIFCGENQVVLSGGVESMSRAPYLMETARWGKRIRHAEMLDLVWKAMQEYPIGVGMGLTAENIAQKYKIERKEQDEYALLSHKRAAKGIEDGKFTNEIIPVPLKTRKKESFNFEADEHVRKDLVIEQLAKLPTAFKKDGTVTAGNACGMNDAAAALVLMSQKRANELNLKPLARIKGYFTAGVDPNYMGIGPVPAIQGALKKSGLTVKDIDRFEINEAFAAQYLACEKELALDREKVNVNGSGIALGHPVGATGTRLLVTLLHILINENLNLGVASLCAGGGLGFAVILERL
ncbi:Acetyl-CoA acetyltransferase [Candidatus Magnetomorum sp. HK-1]|nr:Acetyl-CoA acetyltransferase [Candidatus Magnetomorum sp. HK-1]